MIDARRLRERIEERIAECKREQEDERWYSRTYTDAARKIEVYHEVLAMIEREEARP